jgi:hypothetical protein
LIPLLSGLRQQPSDDIAIQGWAAGAAKKKEWIIKAPP